MFSLPHSLLLVPICTHFKPNYSNNKTLCNNLVNLMCSNWSREIINDSIPKWTARPRECVGYCMDFFFVRFVDCFLVCWRCHFNIVEFHGNHIFMLKMLKFPFKQLCQFSIEIAFGNLRCVARWVFSIILLQRANQMLSVSKSNILRFTLLRTLTE